MVWVQAKIALVDSILNMASEKDPQLCVFWDTVAPHVSWYSKLSVTSWEEHYLWLIPDQLRPPQHSFSFQGTKLCRDTLPRMDLRFCPGVCSALLLIYTVISRFRR